MTHEGGTSNEGTRNDGTPILVYGTQWCADCRIVKAVLVKLGLPHREIDIEHDPRAAEYVMSVNGGKRSVPTLQYNGHAASLSNFSRAKLAAFLERAGASEAAAR